MRKYFSLLLLVLFFACQDKKEANFENLNANRFEVKMKQSPEAVVLDVRTAQEYETGFIENAQNIDVTAADFESKIEALDKNKTIFVYCKGGKRSVTACEILKDKGFQNVINLEGGISAWKDAGLGVFNNP